MKVSLIAVGQKMPAWVQSGFDEYAKRLPKDILPKLIEVNVAHRGKTKNVERFVEDEGKAILQGIDADDFVIALAIDGKNISTEQLATHLSNWQLSRRNLVFLIGGPDGLSKACLNRADMHWSLSKLTLPHPLVRIVFIEQFYRAWSITQNHPYHK